ncbi:RHS repeat-associated core domain-containing protein [Parahaliea aestuarii]|uniref:RHS repeat-associated core domain-containing protein n=1 Tax=Parahaliea aestuarii TaxID=1852021 RepID=UPI001C9BDEAA|nr:RHS repeat-associated core domain-containing protein [Parahaliea aestuarii]
MNGRGYDYNLGRFLSVDPFIVEPGNSQAINPYSYVLNNPLSGVDPTGYTKEKVEKNMVRVKKTGSRIQREVTVTTTTTQNDDGSTTVSGSVSGGLMSDREAVSNGLSNYFQSAGLNEVTSSASSSGIGGQSQRDNVDYDPAFMLASNDDTVTMQAAEALQNSQSENVDQNQLNLFDKRAASMTMPTHRQSDTFEVFAHSDGRRVFDDTGDSRESLSPVALAEKIRSSPGYAPGMRIRLCSCNTGRNQGGSVFAQELSNALQSPVIAPTRFYFPGIWRIDNAVGQRFGFGSFGAKIPGSTPDEPWKTFNPQFDKE